MLHLLLSLAMLASLGMVYLAYALTLRDLRRLRSKQAADLEYTANRLREIPLNTLYGERLSEAQAATLLYWVALTSPDERTRSAANHVACRVKGRNIAEVPHA